MTKAVDIEHLARYTGEDRALQDEILDLFDGQARQLIARLSQIVTLPGTKEWKDIAHTLKGASRGVGANEMAEAAERCEAASGRHTAAFELKQLQDRAREVGDFIQARRVV